MKNLTQGNPTKLMLSFALPVCLGNLFQLFYSLADTRIVGAHWGNPPWPLSVPQQPSAHCSSAFCRA